MFGQFENRCLMWLVSCFQENVMYFNNICKKYYSLKWVFEELLVWAMIRVHTVFYSLFRITIKLICKAVYFWTYYNIVFVQAGIHRLLVSQVIIMEWKWFLWQAYHPCALEWLNAKAKDLVSTKLNT